MSTEAIFPNLTGWEPTRDTLHAYSRVIGVIPRAHAEFHPRWWHISLKVQPDGLATDRMRLPDGGTFWLKMDLVNHKVILFAKEIRLAEFSMLNGTSASAFGDQVLSALADLGLKTDYVRKKFESDKPRPYDAVHAGKYLTVIVNVDRILKRHRDSLSGECGPVQLWPHGFDLAFEWFGKRLVKYTENDKEKESPAQLNLGFSPGDSSHPKPYFYSNPWPFEKEALVNKPLPAGARWFTDSWQGSILPYAELMGDSQAEERLLEYARSVYQISAPTLMGEGGE